MDKLNKTVYEDIKELIIEVDIKPNEKILEKDIAKRLGVSTTPVKNALLKLEHEKFVIVKPRKAYIVSEINLQLLKDIFQARLKLEPIIVELTLKRLQDDDLITAMKNFKNRFRLLMLKKNIGGSEFDSLYDDFRLFFALNCGNQFLESQMINIYNHLTRIRKYLYGKNKRRLEALNEHIEIIDMILTDKNINNIVNFCYSHIVKAQSDFFKNLENSSF